MLLHALSVGAKPRELKQFVLAYQLASDRLQNTVIHLFVACHYVLFQYINQHNGSHSEGAESVLQVETLFHECQTISVM